jgi:hypothetical protein
VHTIRVQAGYMQMVVVAYMAPVYGTMEAVVELWSSSYA